MRRVRILGAVATLAALVTATAATGTAGAAGTTGVGTTKASTTLVSVALGANGSLLNLRLVGDDGVANIDPKVSPSTASSSLSPLTTTSPVTLLNVTAPKVSVSTTGAPQTKTVPTIDLTTPVSSGSISPLQLNAVVDTAQGATSGLSSTLNNVGLVGGLLSIPSATSNLGAAAKPGDATGLRGVSIPDIEVLNLGAVLQGLGIDPGTLTLDQVGNALSALQVTVPNGAANLDGAALKTTVDSITTVLTSALPNGISGLPGATPVPGALPAPLLTLINGVFPGGVLPPGVTDVTGLTTALTDLRVGLLTDALDGIGSAPLLSVEDLVAGLSTKAADTVANSAAGIQASLGAIHVGNVDLPGIDVAATAAQVTSAVDGVQTKVNDVLNTVGLGDLVTIKALDQAKSVASDKGYVNALANLTGLHIGIAPLTAGGTANAVTDTMSSLFGSTPVPALSDAMETLNGIIPTATAGALTQGAAVDVLSVGSTSAFAVPGSTTNPVNPAAPTPSNGTLAVTGGSTQLAGLIGLLLLAMVAGLRWLRRPVNTN